ncbi:MAG: hypothetical protein O7I42_14575, partial [Alphaproteobacteria bacterium]|nr:hypothetical protein [Alphaproteobacteria bacterium]
TGGKVTLTQRANNAEIVAARKRIRKIKVPKGSTLRQEILRRATRADAFGLGENPDFDQLLASDLRKATQRLVGSDPNFELFRNLLEGVSEPVQEPLAADLDAETVEPDISQVAPTSTAPPLPVVAPRAAPVPAGQPAPNLPRNQFDPNDIFAERAEFQAPAFAAPGIRRAPAIPPVEFQPLPDPSRLPVPAPRTGRNLPNQTRTAQVERQAEVQACQQTERLFDQNDVETARQKIQQAQGTGNERRVMQEIARRAFEADPSGELFRLIFGLGVMSQEVVHSILT